MKNNWILVALLLVTALASTVGAQDDTAIVAPEVDQEQSVWWTAMGPTSSAVANLGPLLRSENGKWFRRWTLVVHLPGTDEPLTCVQGIVGDDQSEPVWVEGGSFRVELRPRKGLGWCDVMYKEELESEVKGLEG